MPTAPVTNDSIHTYTWDGYGNATTIDGIGIIYDALDRMVEQNYSNKNTEFIYAPTGFKMQIMNGQSATDDFVPLPGGGSVVYTATLAFYRHPDWLGSSRFASTSARAMYSDVAYAPFGETYAQSGFDISFTGMNRDTSNGLYDFPYREYSTQGRWSQPDPAGLAAVDPTNPQSWNRYAYVMNNPLALTDPTGLVCNGANNFMWDPLADGTGIFTPEDCEQNGGDGNSFFGGGGGPSGGGGQGPGGGQMPGCTPAPDSDNNMTGVAGTPVCDPSNTGAGGLAVTAMRAATPPKIISEIRRQDNWWYSKQKMCAEQGATDAFGSLAFKKEIDAFGGLLAGDKLSTAIQGAVTPGVAASGAEHGLDAVAENRPLLVTIRSALRAEGWRVTANGLGKFASRLGSVAIGVHVAFAGFDGYKAYQECMEN
jgi:RHS repeat-associated protein